MNSSDAPLLQIAVKAAIVNDRGEVLIVREAATGKNNTIVGRYTLVGGRLEAGEAFLDGLKREVREETGLEIEPIRPLHVGEWRPVIHGVSHQIIAIFMLCTTETDIVRLSLEHDAYHWVKPLESDKYNMIDPDGLVAQSVSMT